MALPDRLQFLMDPRAYPHPVRSVDLVETHICWVFLTGEFAYKVKRPVVLSFVDLSSPEHRAFLCHEEVRLNRRFAPTLYLDVCTINADPSGARFGGHGLVIEHAVKMRQFDRHDQLDSLLETSGILPTELAAFGHELACIHAQLPDNPPNSEWGRPQTVSAAIMRNLAETIQTAGRSVDTTALCALSTPLQAALESASQWMAERQAAARIRECHGDLHCGNIVRGPSGLLAFDCLEFDPAMRWIDVADEVAFLLADLDSRNRPAHAQAFLTGYLEHSGDYDACRFLTVYRAHRSLVRAKVALLNAGGTPDSSAVTKAHRRFDDCVSYAHTSLNPGRPVLILMSGLSGSGKTWLASRLAPTLGAVHIRSDVERKRLAGLAVSERSESQPGAGLYSAEMSDRVHRHLWACSEAALAGGYTVVVDATFGRREERRRFAELGRRLGIRTCLIHCWAPPEILRSRIQERLQRGGDPSEADLAVLEWQQKHHEPIEVDELLELFEVSSTDSAALDRVKQYITSVRGTPVRSSG